MLEFLTAGSNLPFSVALLLMIAIAVLEGVGLLLGFGLSALLDQLIPDINLQADVPDLEQAGVLSWLLGWLPIGRVPVLTLLIIFLTAFGLIGLTLQALTFRIMGTLLPGLAVSAAALVLTLPVMRVGGRLIANLLPKDETEAVSVQSFIGRVATITLGIARHHCPAQAKLRDRFGHTHYLMVEPDLPEDEFPVGAEVLLVSRENGIFRAIRNPYPSLTD